MKQDSLFFCSQLASGFTYVRLLSLSMKLLVIHLHSLDFFRFATVGLYMGYIAMTFYCFRRPVSSILNQTPSSS